MNETFKNYLPIVASIAIARNTREIKQE